MSLLKQDIIKKRQVNETASKLEFNNSRSDNKRQYKFKTISDNEVYARESDNYLSGLYYLLSWKNYPKEKNT